LASCNPVRATAVPLANPSATAAPSLTPEPSPTQDPLPDLTLTAGENYFRLNGEPAFIYSRNLAGYKPEDFDTLVMAAHQGGAVLVRVGLDNVAMGGNKGYGYSSDGMINERWSQKWEHFFTVAEANGVYVIPYFTGWMNWNTTGYNTWADNPLNSANGGPAASPTEIFKRDSRTQQLYFKWFRSLVERWQHHRNILAWEVVSEVNLIGYISESQGVDLVEQLAAIAREADDLHRPTTASLADMPGWSDFFRSDAVEFINYHPYPPTSRLDRRVLQEVPRYLGAYDKPLLIGESGLHYATPDSQEGRLILVANASRGLQHAIWAELVSGAMNGRALWWEDGYGVYFSRLGLNWVMKYQDLEQPALRFSQDLDMSNMAPVAASTSPLLFGAALGNKGMLIGWFREAACEPPDWNVSPVISGESVTLTVPGPATRWQVDFYDPKTGDPNGASAQVFAKDGALVIPLSDFSDGIAFKAYAQ
ncbi:MAG TPA: hypothetical protein VFH29_04170, partial [Anaerolineales bacterium]|nr:hypothetical protein [Anaerolineales bacterium]